MEVVILRLTPYREKDYIINALSADGIITLRAPGALTIKSKFAGKLFIGALVDVEVRTTKAGQTITNVVTLNNVISILNSSTKLMGLNLLGEIMQKTLKDDDSVRETFTLVKETLMALGQTNYSHSLIFLFLTNLMRILGFGLVIDRCVVSGKKTNIIGVDLYLGGLISAGYEATTTIALTGEEVQLLRYGFMINETQLLRHEVSENDIAKLLDLMFTYLEQTYNFKIVSKILF